MEVTPCDTATLLVARWLVQSPHVNDDSEVELRVVVSMLYKKLRQLGIRRSSRRLETSGLGYLLTKSWATLSPTPWSDTLRVTRRLRACQLAPARCCSVLIVGQASLQSSRERLWIGLWARSGSPERIRGTLQMLRWKTRSDRALHATRSKHGDLAEPD
jgi:hypothetical protein